MKRSATLDVLNIYISSFGQQFFCEDVRRCSHPTQDGKMERCSASSIFDIDLCTSIQKYVNSKLILHLGIRMKYQFGVDILLNRGAEVNIKDRRGRTPLHFAVLGRMGTSSHIFTEKLLSKGADVNIQNVKGRTPLHVVIKLAKFWMTETLLNSGARLETKDNDGKTPLDFDRFQSTFGNISQKIIKLKAVGFDSHIDYTFVKNHIPTFNIWERLLSESCLKELEAMKLDTFGFHCLYDVFRSYNDPTFVCNLALEEAVKSSFKYPIYNSFLKLTFERAKVRHNLLDTTELKISPEPNNLFNQNVFPREIKRKILSYLSDIDLHNLKKANQE
uniref:F-box domain-containing protein n=1 Tax=Graphocephala atropunctata TaxID=36148 RepID=A0A1B6LVW8_9HEMI